MDDTETDLAALVSDITGKPVEEPSQPDVSRETPPAAPREPARDASGKFVAKPADTQAPATPEAPPAAAPQAAPETPKTVDSLPLAVALEWKAELKEAKKRLAELEESRQTEPAYVPSPLEDPEAYAAYQHDLVNRAQTSARFDTSELIARSAHGDDAVQKAMDWGMERAQASPAFAAEYLKQRHPIDWAVKQMKREELMSRIGDDPDAFVRTRWAELNATPDTPPQPVTNGAAPTQPAAQRQPSPQRSLAAAPTAGSHTKSVPMGLEGALDAAFPTG